MSFLHDDHDLAEDLRTALLADGRHNNNWLKRAQYPSCLHSVISGAM